MFKYNLVIHKHGDDIMQVFETHPKKWGNSLGVVIPKEILDNEGVAEDDEVTVMIMKTKKSTLRDMFGIAKRKSKKTTQQIMDEIDEGYD